MRSRLLSVLAVLSLVVGLQVVTGASGAEGDLLRTLTPPNSGFGVSVAFDGTRVYYTNFNGVALHSVLADGTDYQTVPIVGSAGGINAFSYDVTRDQFWAAGGATGRDIYLMSKTGVAVLQFVLDAADTPGNCDNSFGCLALIDGMAYDGFSDTVWWSPDASQRVYQYDTLGNLMSSFDVNDPPNDTAAQCGFNYSSGIAVSSPTEIYNLANGCQFVFRYTKTGTKVSFFPYQGQRGEDAECDDATFPVTAIWIRDVNGPIQAFEIVGDCPVGGGGRPALDHFKCYRGTAAADHPAAGRNVRLEDQFGASTATIAKVYNMCNPADKNAEGINQKDAHLVEYKLINRRSATGKFAKKRVIIDNQFGAMTLTVQRPNRLMVPSSKAIAPALPGDPPKLLDHFLCYKVHSASPFTKRTVSLEDQFGPGRAEIRKPRMLCNPVSKNGEGIQSEEEHLVCYIARGLGRSTRHDVNVRNQFGLTSLSADLVRHLCVPSEKRELEG